MKCLSDLASEDLDKAFRALQAFRKSQQQPAVPLGVCPDCKGAGFLGGQFTCGEIPCELCAGRGTLAQNP